MKICVAQTRPVKADVVANVAGHQQLIALAVDYRADAVFFPELSLTGYEPALAHGLATTADDPRLEPLQRVSDAHGITIAAGLPLWAGTGVAIGMVIFQPNQPRQAYAKQHLHADELPFFVPGNQQITLAVGGALVAPAICYESLLPTHAAQASQAGAVVYAASVAKPQRGVDKAWLHYPAVAAQYGMTVVMANCVGPCDDFVGAGQSAIWNDRGQLAAQLDGHGEGVVVFDTLDGTVVRHALG